MSQKSKIDISIKVRNKTLFWDINIKENFPNPRFSTKSYRWKVARSGMAPKRHARRETNFFVSCVSVNGHFAFKDIYIQLSKKLFILERTSSSLTQILINPYNIKWP